MGGAQSGGEKIIIANWESCQGEAGGWHGKENCLVGGTEEGRKGLPSEGKAGAMYGLIKEEGEYGTRVLRQEHEWCAKRTLGRPIMA